MSDIELVRRLERTWARDAVAFAEVLAEVDPSWGTVTFPLAGGYVVLCGPGLYVNRVLAGGFERPFTDHELELLERRSTAVGVGAAFDVCPATHTEVVDQLAARSYASDSETAAMVRSVDVVGALDDVAPLPDWMTVERADGDALAEWQEASAAGWGHDTPGRRCASDAFAVAAARVDGDGFVLARDRSDGRVVGVASTTVRDGVATLGGMSTVPTERRRGVQAALIHHRLRHARDHGCDVAASTCAVGSDSERNLERHGFTRVHVTTTWVRQLPSA